MQEATHGKRRLVAALALGAAVAIDATLVCAEIYRWVDDTGTTHYSDSPPKAQTIQPIDAELPPLHPMQRPDQNLTRIQQRAERQRDKSAPRSVAASRKTPPKPQHRCSSWQRQLDKIQSQLRRGYREPRGNKLRERRRELNKLYNQHCR